MGAPFIVAQDQGKPASLIQLIANPDRFDGQIVTVDGFLVLGEHPEFVGQQARLYVHQVDADNLLGNAVWVVASSEMRRNREKLDHIYVLLTGTFRKSGSKESDPYRAGTLTRVQLCTAWSNPSHPIGLKDQKAKYK